MCVCGREGKNEEIRKRDRQRGEETDRESESECMAMYVVCV